SPAKPSASVAARIKIKDLWRKAMASYPNVKRTYSGPPAIWGQTQKAQRKLRSRNPDGGHASRIFGPVERDLPARLWIIFRCRGYCAELIADSRDVVQELKSRSPDCRRAKMRLIPKIGNAILVNCGAAIIETQEIERIDKFPADCRRERL